LIEKNNVKAKENNVLYVNHHAEENKGIENLLGS